jgi:hypothetical protein
VPSRSLVRLRRLCLALPEAHEVEAWGEATFRVRNKMFATFASREGHHGAGHDSAWVKATAENQQLLVQSDPDRYFVPPYVGPSGWIGIRLTGDVDWDDVQDLLRDGYRMIAPKRLLAELDV